MEFKVGDVVMLKSGGTLMTVVEVSFSAAIASNLIRCVWNDHCGHGEMIVPVAALNLRGE